jgi:hypothetical protein
MKVPKENIAVAARKAKRRIENPLAEAHTFDKDVTEAGRQRRIQRTANAKCERLRAKAERRSVTGVEWFAVDANRKSLSSKSLPLTDEH